MRAFLLQSREQDKDLIYIFFSIVPTPLLFSFPPLAPTYPACGIRELPSTPKDTMSTPNRLEAYPAWMLEVASSFKRGVAYRFPMPDKASAQRTRRLLYGLKAAIEKGGLLTEYGEFLGAVVSIRVENEQTILHIEHVEDKYPDPRKEFSVA